MFAYCDYYQKCFAEERGGIEVKQFMIRRGFEVSEKT